jgi:hypothetical protein
MTEKQLIALVSTEEAIKESEEHYLSCGPGKHDQDDMVGVQYVQMNVSLLSGWLCNHENEDAYAGWEGLDETAQRRVWEASGFHYGIGGYEDEDADHWWGTSPLDCIKNVVKRWKKADYNTRDAMDKIAEILKL